MLVHEKPKADSTASPVYVAKPPIHKPDMDALRASVMEKLSKTLAYLATR
jgi:hypothetical protein